ncbi:MAG: DUF4270 domain-containing protein [Paludibacter sp.]|nr:DUF4270 domain-containing protein [Paludibacter sp.]
MKYYPIILILFLSLITYSCTDSLADLGKGIQPSSDAIEIGADTVHLTSSDLFIDSVEMSVNPDSFLLGTYINAKYGSTRADILAQLKSPVEFTLPKGSVADSAKVFMSYYSYFGDAYSPIEVSIHQMDKGWFDYSTAYPTNLNPADYTDVTNPALLMGKKVFTARNASKPTTTITGVSIPLTTDFVKRFFPDTTTANYYSDTNFRKNFKGMYITTNFGSATMLNISQIDLLYYYHYSYTYKKADGVDTTRRVNNVLTFPANDEVRQINRFTHADRKAVVQLDEKYNFIASPANMQANITIPLKRIQQKIDLKSKFNGKKQVINNAVIEVEAVVDEADDTLAMPAVKYLLLVKESAISPTDRFFGKKELPSDTCAIIGTYSASQIGTTGKYKYYYSFNVAGLVANELKNNQAAIKEDLSKYIETLKLRLIPVKVTYNSSGYVTAVTHQNTMSGVKMKSGKNESPMTLRMVYSGF